MDNITHSLTGALAAKLSGTSEVQKSGRRSIFWLFVLSANLPDIDLAMQFIDYFYYIVNHRGITHSLTFAPAFAVAPAFLFYRFGPVKNFRLLWLVALIGILVHIFFDLITSFGTMLFAPFSSERYALDWMFIVDPVFTGTLAILLLLGKFWKRHSKRVVQIAGAFTVLYLLTEFVSHQIALGKIKDFIAERNLSHSHYSALPQPLSIFRWNGLVQTTDGVHQAFFSVFEDSVRFAEYRHSKDAFVDHVARTEKFSQYVTFTRHPWIRTHDNGGGTIVEMRDFQFSIDEAMLKRFGMTDTREPFLLQYEFTPGGAIEKILFDGKALD